jgi:hypothetical protein
MDHIVPANIKSHEFLVGVDPMAVLQAYLEVLLEKDEEEADEEEVDGEAVAEK